MPVEKITLTTKFKVDLTDVDESAISEIYRLFDEYRRIVNELIELAASNNITSFMGLCYAKYRELRQRYPTLPSIYYKAAREIIGATVIVMEDLEIYKKGMGSKELNGRLHRWSYGRFQRILEYQAKLHGLNVRYVSPAHTSSLCPVCGGELNPSPNGRRLRICRKCGLEEGRDVIAVKNLTKRYYEECASAKTSQISL